jgi:predicted TIM-barrel fold metal-dependent hydrolase
MRHRIGVDRIMWGNDFPHSAGDWPNSRRVIEEIFEGVPEEERYRMLVGNAVEFFHLE